MPAQLVERPYETPGRCLFCLNAGVASGPFLDVGRFTLTADEHGFICRSCTAEILRAVDKVPRSELLEAIKDKNARGVYIQQLEQEHRDDLAVIASLKTQLAAAEVGRQVAEEVLRACEAELKKAKLAPAARRRQMLAADLEQPQPASPAPKPKRRKSEP